MNNTLTGLGLALVLALVAALIGPWFVNWTAYRDDFARQASALVGAPVQFTGAIDARLLPSPYLRLRGMTAGQGAARLTIDEIEIELGFAPLLRGELKAERIKLVRPQLGVEALADGRVRTAFSAAGRKPSAPDRVSFDRAEIVGGAIVAATPAGPRYVTKIAGVAEAGSLAGPFRFEGSADVAGQSVEARLSTARLDEKGALRVKFAFGSPGAPALVETDGLLTVAATPAYSGKVVAVKSAPRAPRPGGEDEPWRLAGDLKLDGRGARLEALDLGYGSDERAIRLGGSAALAFGPRPRADLALTSRQVDLDRLIGGARGRTPVDVIKMAAGRLGLSAAPALDGRLTLDFRGVVLAGDVVQDLTLAAASENGDWRLDKASARLPGATSLSVAGAAGAASGGYAGKATFETADLAAFRRWLTAGDETASAPVRRLSLKGDVAASDGGAAVENAELIIEGARSTGRLSWRPASGSGSRGRLEAALEADRLDLDALGVDRLLSQALGERDIDVALAIDAKSLMFAGLKMSDASLDGALGADGVELKQLSVRDAGGVRFSGEGRIAQGADGPQGKLAFKVAGERIAPLMMLARAAGAPVEALAFAERRAAALAPLSLDVTFEAGGQGVRVRASGAAAGGTIEADWSARTFARDADGKLDMTLRTQDGARLAALAGLDLSPAAAAPGGSLVLSLSGSPAAGATGEARLGALGLDLSARGRLTPAENGRYAGDGEASLKSDDLSVAAEALGRLTPGGAAKLPASMTGRVFVSGDELRFEDMSGEFAGTKFAGRLTTPLDPAKPADGALRIDELPLSALAALGLAPEGAAAADARSTWSGVAFGPSPVRGLSARLDIKATRMPIFGSHVAADASFVLRLKSNGISAEEVEAGLDGGRLTGGLSLTRAQSDATFGLSLRLDGARVERLVGLTDDASPLKGAATLQIEGQATGRSLSALAGAFTGAGSMTLTDGVLKRLDAAAIGRVEPKVEAGLALDAPKIADALDRDLGGADFPIARALAPFTVSGGVLRTGAIAAEGGPARLGGGLALDLRRMSLDADLTILLHGSQAPQIGVSFEGPLGQPKRRVDATSLTSWLSIRAVERETKRIEAMEADMRERARIARQRAEEERKKAEEDKRRAEVERRKREAEARALIDALPRPSPGHAPALPPAIDLTAPGGTSGGSDRARSSPAAEAIAPPQSILPPAISGGARQ